MEYVLREADIGGWYAGRYKKYYDMMDITADKQFARKYSREEAEKFASTSTRFIAEPLRIKIWMRNYKPFQMGGNLNQNIATVIDKFKIYDLGKGFRCTYISENGKDYVFELESGGLIGDNIEQVKIDIESYDDISFMRAQIEEASKESETAVEVSYQDFFR